MPKVRTSNRTAALLRLPFPRRQRLLAMRSGEQEPVASLLTRNPPSRNLANRNLANRSLAGRNPVNRNPPSRNPVNRNPPSRNPVNRNPASRNPVNRNPASRNPASRSLAIRNLLDRNPAGKCRKMGAVQQWTRTSRKIPRRLPMAACWRTTAAPKWKKTLWCRRAVPLCRLTAKPWTPRRSRTTQPTAPLSTL